MVISAEGGVKFNNEVDVGKVETTGGDIGAEEDGRCRGLGEGAEGGGAEVLREGAVEAVDLDMGGEGRGGRGCAVGVWIWGVGGYGCGRGAWAGEDREVEVDAVGAAEEDNGFHDAAAAGEGVFEEGGEGDEALFGWDDDVCLFQLGGGLECCFSVWLLGRGFAVRCSVAREGLGVGFDVDCIFQTDFSESLYSHLHRCGTQYRNPPLRQALPFWINYLNLSPFPCRLGHRHPLLYYPVPLDHLFRLLHPFPHSLFQLLYYASYLLLKSQFHKPITFIENQPSHLTHIQHFRIGQMVR